MLRVETSVGGEHAKIALRTDNSRALRIFKRSLYEFSQLAAWPCGSAFFWAFTDWTTLEAARPGQFDIGRRARRQAKLCALLLARGGACRSFHESFHTLSLLSTLGLTLLHHVALTLSFYFIPFPAFCLIHTRQTFPLFLLGMQSSSSLASITAPCDNTPLWSHSQGFLPREEGRCVQFRSQKP